MSELTRRCNGKNRRGEPCLLSPMPGAHVCYYHGGNAPQVRAAAKNRLLAGADLAIAYLLNLLTPKPPCEHCGRSDADRDPVVVKACQLVLDRSGFHPTLTVEHGAGPNEFEGMNIFEVATRAEDMARHARALANAEAARLLPTVSEGHVVEDTEPVQDETVPVSSGFPDDTPDPKDSH